MDVNAGTAANAKNSTKVNLTGTDSTLTSTSVAGNFQEVQDVLSNSGSGSTSEFGESSTNAGAAYAFANAVYKYTGFTSLTADAATGTTASDCASPTGVVKTDTGSDDEYTVNTAGSNTMLETGGDTAANPDGNLTIKGLDAGTYYLWETQVPSSSYATLDKPIQIVIGQAGGYDKEDTTRNICYPKDNSSVASGNEDLYTVTYTSDYDSGKTQTATTQTIVKSSTETLSEGEYKGYANLAAHQILNRKTGSLPITGGQGIALAVIVGLGLVAVGAVVTKRSRKDETAEA